MLATPLLDVLKHKAADASSWRSHFLRQGGGEIVEGQLRFPLVARLPDQFREDPEAIGRILLSAPGGAQLPLAGTVTLAVLLATGYWSCCILAPMDTPF